MVGPFIFFDQMGPAEFLIGTGIDVRPHPHIGLATVTYLFEGEIFHRDSLGTALAIRPGELNLMTAGRGIVHSERETSAAKAATRRLFGIQAWAALPKSHEEAAPAFAHYGTDELPRITGEGKVCASSWGPLWCELAGRFPASEPLRRSRSGAGRRAAARSRLRRASGLRRLRRDRHRRRDVRATAGCWCSSRATASRSSPLRSRGWCCWAASLWTARATSGGISSRHPKSASSRQRRLAPQALLARSGRRRGVHPAAAIASVWRWVGRREGEAWSSAGSCKAP